jgi:phytoene dehydrogenase-like protein
LLARAGRRVLVVERRGELGGLASGDELHPGYRSAGLLQDTGGVRRGIVRELGLERHGLQLRREPPRVLALGDDGPGLMLGSNVAATTRALGAFSARDGQRYGGYRAFIESVRHLFASLLDAPPVDLLDPGADGNWTLLRHAVRLRRLGRKPMMELLRLPSMSLDDWLGEWFECDLLKAALALPALSGTWLGPRSPGSNANLLCREAIAGPGVSGGATALVAALERAARDAGVETRVAARVERILVESERACGVVLDDGAELRAAVVAASCDPRQTFLNLLPATAISSRLEHLIRNFRTRGTTAQLLLALDAPLRFATESESEIEFARCASSLRQLEQAFDAVKHRRLPERPVLEIHVPSVSTPGLAPSGHTVVSALVHFVPFDLEGGWDEDQRERIGDRVLELLERHAPGVSSSVVARKMLAPPDIAAHHGVTNGQIHHGEQSLDQLLVRPVPECNRYRTPLPGLFLCGSGSHPGGGLTCAPGALAARAILT